MFITGGYTVAMFAGVGLMALQNLGAGISIAVGMGAALVIFMLGAIASFATRSNTGQTVREWFDVWALAGTRNLRRTFQVCCELLYMQGVFVRSVCTVFWWARNLRRTFQLLCRPTTMSPVSSILTT